MPPAPQVTVRPAQPAEQRAALELVLTPLAPAARGPLLDSFAKAPPHPLGVLDALIVAVDSEDRVRAACWAQPAPGLAVGFWPTEWVGKRPDSASPDSASPDSASEVEKLLTALAMETCDRARAPMVQTLFEQNDDPRGEALVACGFVRIAELIYLGRSVRNSPQPGPTDGEIRFEPYKPSEHARLKRVLRRTYVDSLDCPGIDSLRDLDDVLHGYRLTGNHNPEHWRFVVEGDTDIGALLLTEHPAADQAELIYLGLAPEARGRGRGKALLDEALATAGRMGVEQLMAAVDAGNLPARKAYERGGYAPWAQRYVFVRRVGGGPIV